MTEQHMRQTNLQDLAQEILAPPAKAEILLTVTVNGGCEEQARESLLNVAGLAQAIGFFGCPKPS
jgi:hypothetical protein